MSTIRLTTYMRDEICTRLMAHQFGEDVEILVRAQAGFAVAVYDEVYTEVEHRLMEQLKTGWLPEVVSIGVQFGVDHVHLEFNGMTGVVGGLRQVISSPPERVFLRVPRSAVYNCVKSYNVHHPLSTEHQKLARRFADIKEAMKRARKMTLVALAVPTTVSSLLKSWPEVEPFLRVMQKSTLPAIARTELNEALGLPVATQKER